MNFVNLTPHQVKVLDNDGNVITFEPSGIVPRVSQEINNRFSIAGFDLRCYTAGQISGLPKMEEGHVYIVPSMVLEAAKADPELKGIRRRLVAPDTGADAVRNDRGHIEYVRGFKR